MKLNFDFSAVTRVLQAMLGELRHKRLWPVAAVLLAGIVAAPVLLSKSPKPSTQAQASVPATPPPSGTALPAISVQSTPGHANLKGSSRDPFAAAAGSGSTGSTATPTTSGAGSVVSTVTSAAQTAVNSFTGSASTGSTSSTTSMTGTSSTTSTGTGTAVPSSPPSITGNAKPKPVQTGLSSRETYDVALSETNSNSGVDTIDPLARLSVLPSVDQPRLIELGVLQGGSRVLFAVQPGTIVDGPGACIPGPLDCEILSLAQDQTEAVSHTGGGAPVALFAVTGITVTKHSSAAVTNVARRAASAAGRALFNQSTLPALSLFKYEPSLGSVVDLRNLTVGG
jgi:hypothetical protein